MRIFEQFYRADIAGNVAGTGLGMSIVKEIVELNHGEVNVFSELKKSTRVRLRPPLETSYPQIEKHPMEFFKPVNPTVLVVNNSPVEMEEIAEILRPHYRVQTACSLALAIQRCQTEPPDLVLADVTLPNPDGSELYRRLGVDSRTSNIPLIFTSRKTDSVNDVYGIDWGSVSFITLPVKPALLIARVRQHFLTVNRVQSLCVDNEYFEKLADERMHQVEVMQNVTVLALAALAEVRDVDTGNHLRRTQNYVMALASYLVRHPRFAAELSGDRVQTLYKCAPLHDIGKVGIPDRILLKRGRYTPEEFKIMQAHPRLGRDAIEAMQLAADRHLDMLVVAKEIVYSHHEKWDGSGYPEGLAGDAIPVSARLMALADVYDALICRRVYKDEMSHAQASVIINEGRGVHFDPDVVDAFLELGDVFQGIAKRYADSDEDICRKASILEMAIESDPSQVSSPPFAAARDVMANCV